MTGSAKADRVSDALAFSNSPVSNAWWYIEHVSWFQYPFFLLVKFAHDVKWSIFSPRRVDVALLANAPAAFAHALQQKHIVIIEVRADAALISRVAHHDVIQPPIGNRSEEHTSELQSRENLVCRLL